MFAPQPPGKPFSTKTRPHQSLAFLQAVEFQALLAKDIRECKNPKTRITLVRAWDELEQTKLKMRNGKRSRAAVAPNPKPTREPSAPGDFEEPDAAPPTSPPQATENLSKESLSQADPSPHPPPGPGPKARRIES
jgi:hypothetical protein